MQGATVQLVNSETVVDMVSIQAPYAGSDNIPICKSQEVFVFQSTPPMQGATIHARSLQVIRMFQSTPPMQGATEDDIRSTRDYTVSIHAPYAESDH